MIMTAMKKRANIINMYDISRKYQVESYKLNKNESYFFLARKDMRDIHNIPIVILEGKKEIIDKWFKENPFDK